MLAIFIFSGDRIDKIIYKYNHPSPCNHSGDRAILKFNLVRGNLFLNKALLKKKTRPKLGY